MTKPIGSKSFSSAIEASTVELDTPLTRETKTTRAASPPLATSTLFSQAPATVARIASGSDLMPIGRRNSHQRTPFTRTERRFTPMAAASRGSEAWRIEVHAACQSIVRAKRMRKTRIAAEIAQRIPFFSLGLIQSAESRIRSLVLPGGRLFVGAP